MDTYNYPLGADTKDAPWNDTTEAIKVNITIETSLVKDTTIETYDYKADTWEEEEYNEDGRKEVSPCTIYDFSNCNFVNDYNDNEFSVIELLKFLKDYVTKDISNTTEDNQDLFRLNKILRSIDGWKESNCEILDYKKDK